MMPVTIKEDLDPICEVASLLFLSSIPEGEEAFIEEQLASLGVDPGVHAKHEKVLSRYISTFEHHKKVKEGDDFFFGDENITFFGFLAYPYLAIPGFAQREPKEAELRELLVEAYNAIFEVEAPTESIDTIDGQLALAKASDLPEGCKWKFLQLMQEPLWYFGRFSELLLRNLPAYEKAKAAVKSPLRKLLDAFQKEQVDFKEHYFVRNADEIEEVTPMLALAFSQMLAREHCYYGLCWDEMLAYIQDGGQAQKLFCNRLKVMGDNSKLEILQLLSGRPWYSQELATELGITPATISYHMDHLLAAGLISLNKKEKRIYYELNRQAMREVVEKLSELFLND